jgi:hypothetical protein
MPNRRCLQCGVLLKRKNESSLCSVDCTEIFDAIMEAEQRLASNG